MVFLEKRLCCCGVLLSVIKCTISLTICAQGSCQHLDALVPDGVSSSQVRGQWAPRRTEAGGHGAGGGGGSFRRLNLSFSKKRDTFKHTK